MPPAPQISRQLRKLLALALVVQAAGCAAIERAPDSSGTRQARTQPYLPDNVPPAKSFIGKGQGDLVALLGKPNLVRREKGVEVWQYAPGSCVLLFYLYEDGGGARRVTYLEAVPQDLKVPDPSPVTPDSCLAEQIQVLAAAQGVAG